MNLRKYQHHLYLLSGREENAKTRFRAFRFSLRTVSSNFCGYADLLEYCMNEAQIFPPTLVDFQSKMKAICETFIELDEKTRFDYQSFTEEEAQANISLYWTKRDVVQAAFALSDRTKIIEHDLDR